MAVRCLRCRQSIDSGSAFAILLEKKGGHALHDIVRVSSLGKDSVALHMNGDPQCGRPMSGYKKAILETLGFTVAYDLSFLDYL